MATVRDNQKTKCYKFDSHLSAELLNKIQASECMPLDECRLLCEICLATFGMDLEKPFEVQDGRRRKSACGGKHSVSLPRWARNPEVVIHEVSHTIMKRAYKHDYEPHGPEFMRILIHLCAKLYNLDERELVHTAKTVFNLKIAPAAFLTKTKQLVKANYI